MGKTLIIMQAISRWWLQKRLQYNKALLFTALMGFLIQSVQPAFYNMMISELLQEMRISGTCSAGFLLLANLAFALGSVMDLVFNHDNSALFRERLFLWGYWFAILVLIVFIILFLSFR